jgi:hypothetical protein
LLGGEGLSGVLGFGNTQGAEKEDRNQQRKPAHDSRRLSFPWAAILPVQLPGIAVHAHPPILIEDEAGDGAIFVDRRVLHSRLNDRERK